MTMLEAHQALQALQMGFIYCDEIGDDAGSQEIIAELQALLEKQPSLSAPAWLQALTVAQS